MAFGTNKILVRAIITFCTAALMFACKKETDYQEQESEDLGFVHIPGPAYIGYRLSNQKIELLTDATIEKEFKYQISRFIDGRRVTEANYETGQDAQQPTFATDSLLFKKVFQIEASKQNYYLAARINHLNGEDKMLIAVSLIWKNDSLLIDPKGTLFSCLVKKTCPDPEFEIKQGKLLGFMPAKIENKLCAPYISVQTNDTEVRDDIE